MKIAAVFTALDYLILYEISRFSVWTLAYGAANQTAHSTAAGPKSLEGVWRLSVSTPVPPNGSKRFQCADKPPAALG